nr:hypothetical protein [uncultured Pseudomonas sp.]
MSAKNLLQPLAAELHASFSASGRPYDLRVIHQLLHAAIGSVAPEVASKDKLPIQVCRDDDTRQYNLYATIERAKKCLGLTDLQAVGVAEEVIEVLRKAKIGVNQVRLLLDPVDDVIRNVLPKYQKAEVDVEVDIYSADIERIRSAFSTDSASQKEKLRAALRETTFVMVVDAGDGKGYVSLPGDTYIATERLKQLFAGVKGVFIVDDDYDCLRGEGIHALIVVSIHLSVATRISLLQHLGHHE